MAKQSSHESDHSDFHEKAQAKQICDQGDLGGGGGGGLVAERKTHVLKILPPMTFLSVHTVC